MSEQGGSRRLGLQRRFQRLLLWLWWLGKGVAFADGAHQEARAVADALLGVQGLGVAQTPLGAMGDDEIPCGVTAHPLAHQALYGKHLLGGAGELERLLPAGEEVGDAVEHAGGVFLLMLFVVDPREEPLLLELGVGLLKGALYLRGVGVIERDLIPDGEEVTPPREASGPLQIYQAVEPLAQGHLEAEEEVRVQAFEVLRLVVADEDRVEPEDVAVLGRTGTRGVRLASLSSLGEVHAPDVEGVGDQLLIGS